MDINKRRDGSCYEFFPKGQQLEHAALIRYSGPHQPGTWIPERGWTWDGGQGGPCKSVRVPGEHWVATYANGRFSTMTAVFPHPSYHGAQEADKEQRDMFYEESDASRSTPTIRPTV